MRSIIGSIEAEYHRYKALGEGAIAQLADAQLTEPGPNGGNPVAVIVWHLSGNLTVMRADKSLGMRDYPGQSGTIRDKPRCLLGHSPWCLC